jgi:hypothetical protein
MNVRGAQARSLRPEVGDLHRLARAFVYSLLLHLLLLGGYKAGQRWQVWEHIPLPRWIKPLAAPPAELSRAENAALNEPPTVFIEVPPHQEAAEPPKAPKFYSSRDSQAANPEADRETGVPKIAGTQTVVPKTEDVPREKFEKLQPALPAPTPAESEPRPTLTPGDLTLARPDEMARPGTGQGERPRPRTLQEALARRAPDQIPGEKMKQAGGVARRANVSMVDARGTTFGAYDAAFIAAVADRWYALLDQVKYDGYRPGRVVLQFNLHHDGRITDLRVAESTVSDMLSLLCQKAVLDPAPYARWPREMRLMVGKDVRPIQFTFYYN